MKARKQNPPETTIRRPKLAVFKFASCDGCQLQLIDLLENLQLIADLTSRIDIAHFAEADSRIEAGPYDLTIVEGSISTATDAEKIREVRADSKYLVTIGACATSGGIQALRNWRDEKEIINSVYTNPEYIDTLRDSTAIADHVRVDFELRGCPINKEQLREVITAFLMGKRPEIPTHSVCTECKRRGAVCVVVARGIPCLGPVTQAGCGALCPAYCRGCYGCYGAMEQPNMMAQVVLMNDQGMTPLQVGHAFRSFAHTAPFECVSEDLLKNEHQE